MNEEDILKLITYKIVYQLTEGKHYYSCHDAISHPIINEAFRFGDLNGSGYNSVEWENEVHAAELVIYTDESYEVFVGEWLYTKAKEGSHD